MERGKADGNKGTSEFAGYTDFMIDVMESIALLQQKHGLSDDAVYVVVNAVNRMLLEDLVDKKEGA